jgi:hypothetical protein
LIPNMSAVLEDFLGDIIHLNGGSTLVWTGLVLNWILI